MYEIRFGAVKELIAEKKYAEARILLKTINHPAAREIEMRLDDIDPPSFSLRDRVPISAKERSTNWNLLIAFLTIIIILILVASMLGVFSRPQRPQTEAERLQSTTKALEIAANSTATAREVAFLAGPTETPFPPTSTRDGTLAAYQMQTREALAPYQTQTREAFAPYLTLTSEQAKSDWDMHYATENAAVSTSLVMNMPTTKPTHIPRPTRVVTATAIFTPISETYYYSLDPNWLLSCPDVNCADVRRLSYGARITVVGIVDGSFNSLQANKWYKIRLHDSDKTVYAYQFIEWFSLTPPSGDEHSVLFPVEMWPTSRPTLTFGPSPTPRPTLTPTRRP